MGLAIQIEDAAIEAEMLRSTLLAVEEAIYNGNNSYEEYEWAFLAVVRMVNDHTKHLKVLTEEVYTLQRQGGMECVRI